MNTARAVRILSSVGPGLAASLVQEKVGIHLNRWHLSTLDARGQAVIRRILGDPVVIEVDGLKIQGPFDSRRMLALMKAGQYEPLETKLFKQTIRPGMTVLDIGANIGFYSLLAARGAGGSRGRIRLRARPSKHPHLRVNAQANDCPNIKQFNTAVADKPGTHVFQMAARLTQSSLSRSWDMPNVNTVEVETLTIDDAIDGRAVDVIKMDIEGGEPAALQGMMATLRANPGIRMFVEFEPPALEAAGRSPEAFLDSLRSLFADVSLIDESRGEVVALPPTLGTTQNLICSGVMAP